MYQVFFLFTAKHLEFLPILLLGIFRLSPDKNLESRDRCIVEKCYGKISWENGNVAARISHSNTFENFGKIVAIVPTHPVYARHCHRRRAAGRVLELYYSRARRTQRIVREIDFISCFAPITRTLNTHIAPTLSYVSRRDYFDRVVPRQPLHLTRSIKGQRSRMRAE